MQDVAAIFRRFVNGVGGIGSCMGLPKAPWLPFEASRDKRMEPGGKPSFGRSNVRAHRTRVIDISIGEQRCLELRSFVAGMFLRYIVVPKQIVTTVSNTPF